MNTNVKKIVVVIVMFLASAITVSQADAAGRCGRMSFRELPSSTASSPAAVASAEDGTVRRSFSYEPSYRSSQRYSQSYSQRYSAPKKDPWQYPKTDPRRYRSH